MAYSTSNPPMLILGSIANKAPNLWAYRTADAEATFSAANYISNAAALGMKQGDFVFVFDTATPKSHMTAVLSVTAGGAGSLVASGNNFDITQA